MKTRGITFRGTNRILVLIFMIIAILVLLLCGGSVTVVVAFRMANFRTRKKCSTSRCSSLYRIPKYVQPSSTVSSYLDHESTWNNGASGSPEANNKDRIKAETEWMTQQQQQQKQQQKMAAPLVDSTLLRFVANNARPVRTELNNTNPSTYCLPTADATSAVSSINNVKQREGCNDKVVVSIDTEASLLPNNNHFNCNGQVLVPSLEAFSGTARSTIIPDQPPAIIPEQPPDDKNLLFDTFERQVVTILLNSCAQENDAIAAAQSLRHYATEKSRRESVRKFLQNRDTLWKSGYSKDNSTFVEDFESNVLISTTKWCSKENVQAVIHVLVNAGLSGKDCASVFMHTPSVAFRRVVHKKNNDDPSQTLTGETIETTLNRVINVILCGLLQLRRYDARKVIRACPGLLTVKGSRDAFQVINLLSKMGVSQNALARDKSAIPVILSRPPSLMFRLIAFLSSDLIRMPMNSIGSLLRRSSTSSKLLDVVVPVTSITSMRTMRTDQNHLNTDSIIGTKFIDTAYDDIEATCKYLKEEVGVEDIAKVIVAYPGVLLLNITTELCPLLDYLYDENGVGLDKDSVSKMIQTFPLLLSTRNVNKTRETVQYLQNSLEVSTESLQKIVRAFPSILLLDLEADMLPVVNFLRNTCGVVNIGRFVTRFPPILGYSVKEDLLPKWEFLSKVCDFRYFEVVRFPAYFSYPLEKVILPRYEYLKVKSIPFELVTIDEVLRFGDADFARIVVGDKDNGAFFSRFLEERRKRMKGTGGPPRRP